MRKQNKGLLARWRERSPVLTAAGTIGGSAVTVLFAVYNGVLGIRYASLWHKSICIYYILLSLLRGILLFAKWSAGKKEGQRAENYRKRIFRVTSGMALVMNAALATPVFLMVLDRRPIQTGLTPAIASATYTTYKISAAAVKMKREKGTELDLEWSMIRLVDALVSVLVLQNTLVIAVEGSIPQRMFPLVVLSSGGILLLIFAMSVAQFVKSLSPGKRARGLEAGAPPKGKNASGEIIGH